MITSLASGSNYFVNDGSTSGDLFCSAVGNAGNSGTTSGSPKVTLTDVWNTYGPSGTNILVAGDTVFVDAGTYFQTDRDLYFTVAIVISGAGMERTTFDNGQDGITGNYFARLGASAHLENFKIMQYGIQSTYAHAIEVEAGVTGVEVKYIHIDDCGRDSGEYPIEVRSGAGVLFQGGGLSCNAWLQSGGMHIVGATTNVQIIDYVFYKNSRGFDDGAALRMENGTVSIKNSLFEANRCNNGGVSIVYQDMGTLNIYDSKFIDNEYLYSFNEYGGTILVNEGTFYMTRSEITGVKRVGGSFAYGAGICLDGTSSLNTINAQIDSCYFATNTGSRGNDLHAQRSNTTVNVFQTTFGSTSAQVGTRNSSVVNLTNCGNPSLYAGGGTVNKLNILTPTYTPSPVVADYSGNCGAVTILPVELIGFNGECADGSTHLNWSTATESNNDYFFMERSSDGFNFENIISIDGAMNSQSVQNYQFVDRYPENGTNYYRLSQVDLDGTIAQLKTIAVSSNCINEDNTGSMHFNPSTSEFLINYRVEEQKNVEFVLRNSMAQEVYRVQLVLEPSTSQTNVSLTKTLSSGLYHGSVEGEGVSFGSKLLIAF